jgi:hypothetical protein
VRDPVKESADAAGVTYYRTPVEKAPRRRKDSLLDVPAHLVGERWAHATARIFRIVQGAGEHHATTIDEGLKNAECPQLAAEVRLLLAYYGPLRYRRDKWNPFLDLNDFDAARKLMAAVINICDRSTGRLGHWYTK